MADFPDLVPDDRWILEKRDAKNPLDIQKPYAVHQEAELSYDGLIEETGTIFLTNRECPFRCLMCDLWKNTTDSSIPAGIIPEQIQRALTGFQDVRHIKLYNSGNFFDRKAVPPKDYTRIAELLGGFRSVIIENHPQLINHSALEFRDLLDTELEIAIGLETIHPEVLPRLNKKMELPDFKKSVKFLKDHGIRTRAFILQKPPFLDEMESVVWAKRSIDFAFDAGVDCCVVIPTRPGNGAMDWLMAQGFFSLPKIESLEEIVEYGIDLKKGRVFADLWDLEFFSNCQHCFEKRKGRLNQMNLSQEIKSQIQCSCSKNF